MSQRESDDLTKALLHSHLQELRESLLWKLEALPEAELRRPMTLTGTNLLGLAKHLAADEFGHFQTAFGRPVPDLPQLRADADPALDFYATEDETAQQLVDLYRDAAAASDATISELPLDAPARVPWWPQPETTLRQVLVHHIVEVARHVGHADIVRELVDGQAGLHPARPMLPSQDKAFWEDHVEQVRTLAMRSQVGALDPDPGR